MKILSQSKSDPSAMEGYINSDLVDFIEMHSTMNVQGNDQDRNYSRNHFCWKPSDL